MKKKKCTASGCRRTFSYHTDGLVVCPHCKKVYPGLGRNKNSLLCNVEGRIYDFTNLRYVPGICRERRIYLVRYLHMLTGKELRLSTCVGIASYLKETGCCPVKVYEKPASREKIRVLKSAKIW